MPANHPDPSRSPAWIAPLTLVLLAWTIQIVLLTSGFEAKGPAAFDERGFHTPTVVAFSEQMPTPDLSDYNVATAPAHHLALGAVKSIADPSQQTLRFISGQPTVLLLALLAGWVARRAGVAWGIAAGLAMLSSSYILPQLILTLPEGSAWLIVAAILFVGLRPRRSTRELVLGVSAAAALAAVLVAFRQLHLWTAAVAWLIAWLGRTPATQAARVLPRPCELALIRRVPRTLAAVAATLPAFAIVAALFHSWGGPVPPEFQESGGTIDGATTHAGPNPATPALVFGIAGLILPLLLTPIYDELIRSPRHRRRAALLVGVGVALGLVAALAVPTTLDRDAGRWTGIWRLATFGPSLADRSLVIAALAAAGAGLIGLTLACMESRDRIMLAGVILAFTAAQTANLQAWTRYVEPMIILLGLAAIGCLAAHRDRHRPLRPWTLAGPLLLAAGAGVRTTLSMLG